ncbi:PAQR family membrane homeostasis protein TrhA [Niveispirillum sp. KHB5.9]|uniref:PAQR family membrane homeostasis protein TrhA n=1 Tax=Niveispirillum sp. KHB5.9 TaxID=3400269 RepID=UPI003A8901BC
MVQDATTHPVDRPSASYSRGEYRADAIVHLLGVTAGWVGGFCLAVPDVTSAATPVSVMALAVYAMAMTAMLISSAAYNLAGRPALKEHLRRLDHACIYLAIAGTYTPLLTRLPDMQAILTLSLVWAIAGSGAMLKLLAPRRHERLGLALYIGLGWIGLPLIPALSGLLLPDTGIWIGLGAIIYTAGIGAYLAERVRYHNVVWHLMVLAAAACHYKAIWVEFRA